VGQVTEFLPPPAGPLHGVETLQESVGGDAELVHGPGVLADEVESPEVDGVHSHPLGELVHLDLEREPGLNRPVAALGAAGRLVGVGSGRVEPVRRHRVRGAQELTGVVGRHQPEGGIGPAVQNDLGVYALELAARVAPRPVLHVERVPPPVGVKDLLTGVEDLHRSPGGHGELRHAELEVERLALAAEGATHQRLQNAYTGRVDLEDPGKLPVEIMRDLGGGPDGELSTCVRLLLLRPPVGLPQPYRTVGLDGSVRRPLEEVLALHHHVRAFHEILHLPELEADLLGDVSVPPLLSSVVDVRHGPVGFQALERVQKRV
jgi:hypothetical protein